MPDYVFSSDMAYDVVVAAAAAEMRWSSGVGEWTLWKEYIVRWEKASSRQGVRIALKCGCKGTVGAGGR
jgi:hypothetical protein